MHPHLCLRIAIVSVVASCAAVAGELSSSAGVRVWHDTNLYLQNPVALPAATAAATEPARQAATAVQASLAVRESWHAAEGLAVDASYGADLTRYVSHASENHVDHNVGFTAAEHRGLWTAEVNGRVLYVDGSGNAPTFLQPGGAPAIGGEPVRSRREQETERASARLVRQDRNGFVRGSWSWLNQDFHTEQRTTAGCANYVDRGEWLLGADLGRRAVGDLVVFAGARSGQQHQADLLGVAHNYSNGIVRALAGLEGNVGRTLKVAFAAGPDWRVYGHSVRAGFERRQQTTYAETSLAWSPTTADTFTLTGKRYLWVASGGRGAYLDTTVDLGWKRKFAGGWTAGLTAGFHEGDSARYNPALRRDQIFTALASVGRSFGALRVAAEVMHDWAESLVPGTAGREYTRWIPALSVARAW